MEYGQLDFSRFETRFLRTLEPIQNSPTGICLRFETVVHSLSDPPDYVALSYCWGDVTSCAQIEVEGKIVGVSKNLHEALKHAKLGLSVLLWADAICINQTDLFEKAYQVNMMGLIFSSAKEVIAWLGMHHTSEDNTRQAFNLAAQLTFEYNWHRALNHEPVDERIKYLRKKRRNLHWLLKDIKHPAAALASFEELVSRPYWQRVWIIQEIAKAQRVRLRCGNMEVGLDEFLGAWSIMDGLSYRSQSILKAIICFRSQEQRATGTQFRICLADSILMSRFSLATDERDKIYAILGLSSDGADLVPTPTYAEPLDRMLIRLSRAILKSHASGLALLLTVRAPLRRRFKDAPPWAVDWTDLASDVPPWYELLSNGNEKKISSSALLNDNSELLASGRYLGEITFHPNQSARGSPDSFQSARGSPDSGGTSISLRDDSALETSFGRTSSAISRQNIRAKSSVEVIVDLCGQLLDRLAPDVATYDLPRSILADALSRMIRDVDQSEISEQYDSQKVWDMMSALGSLQFYDQPVWWWAREYNDHRRRDKLNDHEETTSASPLLQSLRIPIMALASLCGIRNSRRKAMRVLPEQAPLLYPQNEPVSDDLRKTLISVAFRVWTDFAASLNSVVFPFRFCVMNHTQLILLTTEVQNGSVFVVDGVALPLVLFSRQSRDLTFELLGEACLGRSRNRSWVDGQDLHIHNLATTAEQAADMPKQFRIKIT